MTMLSNGVVKLKGAASGGLATSCPLTGAPGILPPAAELELETMDFVTELSPDIVELSVSLACGCKSKR